jgi:hypothetical protein
LSGDVGNADITVFVFSPTRMQEAYMAKPTRATQEKRRRDRVKQERKEEKRVKRAVRKEERLNEPEARMDGVDPDLIGIYPGPQPIQE